MELGMKCRYTATIFFAGGKNIFQGASDMHWEPARWVALLTLGLRNKKKRGGPSAHPMSCSMHFRDAIPGIDPGDPGSYFPIPIVHPTTAPAIAAMTVYAIMSTNIAETDENMLLIP